MGGLADGSHHSRTPCEAQVTTLPSQGQQVLMTHLAADLNLEEVDLPKLTENSQATVAAKIIGYHGFLSLCS